MGHREKTAVYTPRRGLGRHQQPSWRLGPGPPASRTGRGSAPSLQPGFLQPWQDSIARARTSDPGDPASGSRSRQGGHRLRGSLGLAQGARGWQSSHRSPSQLGFFPEPHLDPLGPHGLRGYEATVTLAISSSTGTPPAVGWPSIRWGN